MVKKTNILNYLYSFLVILLFYSVYQVHQSWKSESNVVQSVQPGPSEDTLHILGSANLTAISPYDAIFADDVFLINQVYQGLVKLDNHLIEVPELARYWAVDSGHTHYTFYLKENQIFHNGDTVYADDVVASLEYFLRYKTDSYIHPYFKVIKGVDEFCQGKSPHVEGIKKESPLSVSFYLKHPYIPFLKLLSLPEAKVMPASILGDGHSRLSEHPIGSGPYMIKEKTSSHILLEAFRWKERKDKSVGIRNFKIWLDYGTVQQRLDHHDFDIAYSHVRDFVDTTGQFDAYHTPSLALTFMGINCQKPPTDNRLFRRALLYGIDQDQVRREFGSNASTVNFYCPLNLPRDVERFSYQHHDSVSAESCLKTAAEQVSSDTIPMVSLAVDSTLYSNVITGVVLQNLERLAIPYRVVYYSNLTFEVEKRLLQDHNLFIFGWYMDVPDPEYFFDVLFNSMQSTNLMGYSNPVVDSLLNECYSNQHIEDRLRTYVKIEKILMEDAPIVPLINDYEKIVFRRSLRNVMFNRLGIVGLELSRIRVLNEADQPNIARLSRDASWQKRDYKAK